MLVDVVLKLLPSTLASASREGKWPRISGRASGLELTGIQSLRYRFSGFTFEDLGFRVSGFRVWSLQGFRV